MQSPHLRLIYALPAFISGIAAAILAFTIWRRRPSQPAAALSVYLLSVAVWSVAYSLQLLSHTLEQQTVWSKMGYLGPAGVSLAGLLFVLQYSGLNEWVRTPRVLLLSVIPVATQILAWTNGYHHLIWRRTWLDFRGPFPMMGRSHGPWYWVFLVYGYTLCLIAIVLLAREFLNRRGIYRSQTGVLLLGCLVPMVGNALYAFGIEPMPNIDFTVYGFFITGISMAWGLFRFQLPVIMPLARQTVFEGLSDGVIALDTAGNVVEVNPEAARILGEPARSLIGRPALTALKKHLELAGLCGLPQETRIELYLDTLGTSRLFDVRCSLLKTRQQNVVGSLIVMRDITDRVAAENVLRQAQSVLEQKITERTADLSRTIEELRTLEDQLTIIASHDSLTHLPNRALFLTRVAEHLQALSLGKGPRFAIFYLDIDRFKIYNDGYGHHLGDLILCEMGKRLTACLTPLDTVARMGGDEFTMLLHHAPDRTATSHAAELCLRALAAPLYLEGVEIHLTGSIGVALATDGSSTAEDLVRDADLAMYRAKRQSGNRIEFFGESMRVSALSLVQLQQDLRLSLERGQIVVHYQPFIRMESGKIIGFEALVRWQHPEFGLLQPAQFLPIAEQTGTLMEIDEFVLCEACRQRSHWEDLALPDAPVPFVSVNVSGWQFSHPQRWWQTLTRLNPARDALRLEMMESVLVTNEHASSDFFAQVRARHLDVLLDDFGTGYSSLSWLSHFPIRSLKIDRSFVQELEAGGRAASVVRAIIALARVLEMEVIAEGVESLAQAKLLQTLGCEIGQGFLFSPAVDGPSTIAMLSHKARAKATA